MLEEKVGYVFKNKALLLTALTHSSYANENRYDGGQSYERLEFLGDSILGFVTAEHLYQIRKTPEGELTRLRANLVCEMNLVQVAGRLGLGEYVRLGRGEEQAKGRTRPSILADVVEALIAAIYLDGGIEESSGFIHRFILTSDSMITAEQGMDYKTGLQEYVQRKKDGELIYRVIGESGPDHDKLFEAEAVVNGRVVGRGIGHSKKEAEQLAACDAMKRLGV